MQNRLTGKKSKKILIGLTGGIGSGKSTVANMFTKLDVTVIDTDKIAHDLVKKKSPFLKAIAEHFGKDILQQDGNLNRDKLKTIIFKINRQRKWLEELLHPEIIKIMLAQAERTTSSYCMIVVPLLFEKKLEYLFDKILVVDIDEKLQQNRTKTRDNLPQEQLDLIVKAQATRKQRRTNADDVVKNSGNIKFLESQVKKLHKRYLAFCQV